MQKRIFYSNPPGLTLFIPDYQEFIGGRWVNYAHKLLSFAPNVETDDPRTIRAIRSTKGYGTSYHELDPETNRTTTFPVDYGLLSEEGDVRPEGKPITIKAKDLTRR